jgi:flagellar biogenesis protein FliO
MADQVKEVSTGTKIAFMVGSLIVATAYFILLDWALMDMQGLDYFYMFRK